MFPPVLPPMSRTSPLAPRSRPWPDSFVNRLASLRSSPLRNLLTRSCCQGESFCLLTQLASFCAYRSALLASTASAVFLFWATVGCCDGCWFSTSRRRMRSSQRPVKLRSIHIWCVPASRCISRCHRERFRLVTYARRKKDLRGSRSFTYRCYSDRSIAPSKIANTAALPRPKLKNVGVSGKPSR